jgi:MFS family permease
MLIGRQVAQVRSVVQEYPRVFWTLVGATFVDQLGGALLFPFYSLYVTSRFGVGMTEVGLIFALFSVANVGGNVLGGALADHLGRKGMVILGLVASAATTLFLGLVSSIRLFMLGALVVGLFASAGGPARQAMVADILPEEKRAQGFGILRVSFNLAVTVGPAIGGLLASKSYLWLFIADTVGSSITALLVYILLPETKPEAKPGVAPESMSGTFAGYGRVLRDAMFMAFLSAFTVMTIVYIQMNTTLGVYLRDVHGVSTRAYGVILSLNALMVVLMQFPITRRIQGLQPYLVMALGTALYALGFAMYGLVSAFSLFLLAMVVITLGEMLVAPVSQALVAQLSPEDMRGRYMAVFGFSWIVAGAVGPTMAGVIMDHADPRWVWYASGLLGAATVAAFLRMHQQSLRPAVGEA